MQDRRIHWVPLDTDHERRLHARRQSQRVEVELTVHCIVDGHSQQRRATNLSAGGLYLRSGLLLPVGARPLLEFRVPGDDKPIRCFGEVRSQVRALLPGMNVAFDGITTGDRVRLQRFLDQVDPPHCVPQLPEIELEEEPVARTTELEPDYEFQLDLELDLESDTEIEAEIESSLDTEIDLECDYEPELELELDA